jgi:hypothetical protein
MERASHRIKVSEVNHLTEGVPYSQVDRPAKCCCLTEFPQLQPVFTDKHSYDQVADELAMLR